MHDVVDDVGRLAVGGRAAGFDAAALVDRHVDDYAARLHVLEVIAGDQHGGLRARNQHGPDDQIGPGDQPPNGVPVAEQHVDVGRHDVVEITQPIHVDVEDRHIGPKPGGDLGGVGPHDSAAEDHDLGRRDARHAAQQNTAAHLRPFQILRAFLNAHSPGHFAHRGEQRQPAPLVAKRFVSDRRDARLDHRVGHGTIGGEVKVSEHDLPAPQQRPLRLERLLDLNDHLRPSEHLLGLGDQLRSAAQVIVIGQPGTQPRARFNQHLMPGPHQFLDPHRQQRHAIFIQLRFSRHTDDHILVSFASSADTDIARISTDQDDRGKTAWVGDRGTGALSSTHQSAHVQHANP